MKLASQINKMGQLRAGLSMLAAFGFTVLVSNVNSEENFSAPNRLILIRFVIN